MGVTVLGVQHHFYPRSPCGERRKEAPTMTDNQNFYPRSPCGERLLPIVLCWYIFTISIHALLAESD